MTRLTFVAVATLLACAFSSGARAEFKPNLVHTAEAKKLEAYVRDGMIVGGDQAINEFVVKDIRRAANKGFERIVIDMEGSKNGESAGVQRPPYYQVAVTPDERRVVFSIFGKPRLSFNSKKIVQTFKRSRLVTNAQLLPQMEDDVWTFAMELDAGHAVEVFELSNPVRIIIDIQAKVVEK